MRTVDGDARLLTSPFPPLREDVAADRQRVARSDLERAVGRDLLVCEFYHVTVVRPAHSGLLPVPVEDESDDLGLVWSKTATSSNQGR